MPTGNATITGHRPPPGTVFTVRKPTARTRVSNGNSYLAGIDGRSLVARRYRDIIAAIAADQGGSARMSEARMQLCRRFAALSVQAEMLEAELANGKQIDIGNYATLTSTLVRVVSRLGINRAARDITPSLAEILSESENEEPEPEEKEPAP